MSKLACPRCESTDLVKRGFDHRTGRQRWWCRNPKCSTKQGWHGLNPLLVSDRPQADEKPTVTKDTVASHVVDLRQYRKDSDRQVYLITAAQNATPINRAFWDTCLHWCKRNGARPIVIPYRYKNPTSHWSAKARNDDWWDEAIIPFAVNHRFNLNHAVEVLADIKGQPTATTPLSAFETISGGKWGVFGHPKIQLQAVPHPDEPKVLVSTGAVTQKNYTPTKAGKKGEFHHSVAAVIVETRGNKTRFIRHVMWDGRGFFDLDGYYTPTDFEPLDGIEALVMGDTHVDFVDPLCVKATFGEGGMVEALKPRHLIWHDLNDFYAGSHHHDRPDMFFTRYMKHHAGRDNVKDELQRAFQFVNEHAPPDAINVFPYSNHANEHLWKWLNRKDPRSDPTNFRFWIDTWRAIDDSKAMGKHGAESIDPFAYWGARMLNEPTSAVFLGSSDSFVLQSVDVGGHGHLGPNGAPGTLRNLARMGSKGISGHVHSPGIYEGHMQVGTSSLLRLEYNKGPSSWMHCHGALYGNGKRTLLFIIGDEWRA